MSAAPESYRLSRCPGAYTRVYRGFYILSPITLAVLNPALSRTKSSDFGSTRWRRDLFKLFARIVYPSLALACGPLGVIEKSREGWSEGCESCDYIPLFRSLPTAESDPSGVGLHFRRRLESAFDLVSISSVVASNIGRRVSSFSVPVGPR